MPPQLDTINLTFPGPSFEPSPLILLDSAIPAIRLVAIPAAHPHCYVCADEANEDEGTDYFCHRFYKFTGMCCAAGADINMARSTAGSARFAYDVAIPNSTDRATAIAAKPDNIAGSLPRVRALRRMRCR
jgi:hypothetical protein